eukprot:1517095-Rhodomonas_salina.1
MSRAMMSGTHVVMSGTDVVMSGTDIGFGATATGIGYGATATDIGYGATAGPLCPSRSTTSRCTATPILLCACGTDVGYAATQCVVMLLYAKPGYAAATRSSVLTYATLLCPMPGYAAMRCVALTYSMCGTDIRYATTRSYQQPSYQQPPVSYLQVPYALTLCRYALYSTEMLLRATVLIYIMMLRAVLYQHTARFYGSYALRHDYGTSYAKKSSDGRL